MIKELLKRTPPYLINVDNSNFYHVTLFRYCFDLRIDLLTSFEKNKKIKKFGIAILSFYTFCIATSMCFKPDTL